MNIVESERGSRQQRGEVRQERVKKLLNEKA
jgi:hypothetical protein